MTKKMHSESSDQDADVIATAVATRDEINEPHHHDHDHDHGHHHHDHDDHHGHEHNWDFVEDPSFSVEYKGECAYEVGVKIPAANRAKKADDLLLELQSDAQIPGFRKGKAPKALVQSKFGKAMRNDVFQKLVGEAFEKMVHDEGLRPLSLPDIDGVEDALAKSDETDIELVFKFEVAPRCTLGSYTGLKVERPVLDIDEKHIASAIDEMRGRYGVFEPIEKGKSEDGDMVTIDFTGLIDGEPFSGNSAENYTYFIGSKRFFPEFEAALIGAKAGQEVTATVPFPEDYHGKDVAGKTAVFSIKINEIKRKQLPELNDDFAKEVGYDDLAAMREKVSGDLRAGASSQSQRIAENRILKLITDASTFEIPESLIASSANEYYRQELRRLVQLRVPPSEVQARDAQLLEEARQVAIDQIKAFVAINEIGVKEGIKVTEHDFAEEAHAIMQRTGMNMDAIQRFLQGDEQRSDYEGRIYRRKALQIVLNASEIKDVVVSQDELDKEDEDTDEA